MNKIFNFLSKCSKEEKVYYTIFGFFLLAFIGIFAFFIQKYIGLIFLVLIFFMFEWYEKKSNEKALENVPNPEHACHDLIFRILVENGRIFEIQEPNQMRDIIPVNEYYIGILQGESFYKYLIKPKNKDSLNDTEYLNDIKQIIDTKIKQALQSPVPNIIKYYYKDCPALYIFDVLKSYKHSGFLEIDILPVYNDSTYQLACTLEKQKNIKKDVSKNPEDDEF